MALPLGAALVAGLDQGVKRVVLDTRPDLAVIPGLFSVTLGTNTGVAFGLFGEFPLGVTLLGLGLLAGILGYAVRVAAVAGRIERTALALLVGGAAGNLIDRFRLGYVVDYLEVYVVSRRLIGWRRAVVVYELAARCLACSIAIWLM